MKKILAFWLVVVSLCFVSLASCKGDEREDAKGGGGNGGSGEEYANAWKKGEIGKADRIKTIMENGGPVLAIDIQQNVKPLMKTMNLDPKNLPPTIPEVDFSEALPNSVLVMEVPPYLHSDAIEPAYPPYTVYIHPDGKIDAVQHYQDWTNELATNCFGTFPITLNGVALQSFSGMIWDVASGLNRHFIATNASDCIYEVFPTGEMDTLACGIEGPSSLDMHPMGYLLITSLPGFSKDNPSALPARGMVLYKLNISSKELTEIAEMPIEDDYDTQQALCFAFPYTDYALPTTMRNSVSVFSDGSLAVTDTGGGRIYKVSPDGSVISEYAKVSSFVAGITVAPNDVLYGIFPPILGLDELGPRVIKGATLTAWDEAKNEWVEVAELPGYIGMDDSISAQNIAIPCPNEFKDDNFELCLVPLGLYVKLIPGQTPTNPYIMISDPVTMRIFQVILDYGTETEPVDGSAGSAGASGSGGAGGEGGSAGSSGSAGVGGSAGTAGSAGN